MPGDKPPYTEAFPMSPEEYDRYQFKRRLEEVARIKRALAKQITDPEISVIEEPNTGGRPPQHAYQVGEPSPDRMLKWFDFEHLKPPLRETSEMFSIVAHAMCKSIVSGPERTVALRKLLEAKDAAVRAVVNPGG